MLHCTLCQRVIRPGEASHCSCGQVLHRACAADHEPYCPTVGEEPWIGIEEF